MNDAHANCIDSINENYGFPAERFISQTPTSVKLHLHLPDDTILHKSYGAVKNRKKAFHRAIRDRNKIGKEKWGNLWDRVLKEKGFFERIPHSLEPALVHKPSYLVDGTLVRHSYYLVRWLGMVCPKTGHRRFKSRLFSLNRYGKLGAYVLAKLHLQKVQSHYLPVIEKMDRYAVTKLK